MIWTEIERGTSLIIERRHPWTYPEMQSNYTEDLRQCSWSPGPYLKREPMKYEAPMLPARHFACIGFATEST